MTTVLDASALLAFLLDEPGQDIVDVAFPDVSISAVNWAEVLQQLIRRDVDPNGCRTDLEALGLTILPFDTFTAEQAAQLWTASKAYGLSLGDRACIATGLLLDAPILTGDRVWLDAFPAYSIKLIRA